MFPHEEFLQKACEECKISQLVSDLGGVYLTLVNRNIPSDRDFRIAMEVDRILKDAAEKIADLGSKLKIPHPMDNK